MRSIAFLPFITLILLGGCGTPSLLITPVSNTSELEEVRVQPGSGFFAKKVAIVEVEGMLMNARTGGFLQPQENKVSLFTQQLDTAANDEDVVAVVLRVNSPGGTVTASDTMYQNLLRFKAKTHKPVIASTQDVAASGAFYVCCGADKIVVHPTSVVGSIGVIFNTFNIEGTMQKIGARAEAIKSGPLKDMGSPFKPISPEERAVMQGMVDEYFARFVGVVTTNRKELLAPANVKTATDGRVMSGEDAVKIGLADQVGLLDDAIDLARKLSNTPGAGAILYKRPYGYGGSIYAANESPAPQASQNVLQLEIPGSTRALLPSGFYYLWEP